MTPKRREDYREPPREFAMLSEGLAAQRTPETEKVLREITRKAIEAELAQRGGDPGKSEGTHLLIDPPVSPYSTRDEIEAWIQELEDMKLRYPGDETALESIRFSIEQARTWMEWKRSAETGGD